MNRKITTICVLTLVTIPVLTATANGNFPPTTTTIEGVTDGIIGTKYDYLISTRDPESDEVYFKINWGDNMLNLDWEGPFKSDEKVSFSHIFSSIDYPGGGIFTIIVETKDEHGDIGDTEKLQVTMNTEKEKSKDVITSYGKTKFVKPVLRILYNMQSLLDNLTKILKIQFPPLPPIPSQTINE
jgi:hypothetical protein